MKHVFVNMPNDKINIHPQNIIKEARLCLKCSGVKTGDCSTLTTHCSGRLLTESLHQDILDKKVDYLNGRWIVNGIFTKRRSIIL